MASATEHDAALRRIAALASQAANQPDIPASIATVLAEIVRLAGTPSGDTPEPSDIPRTENQSL